MTQTATRILRYGKGYAGKLGNKCYIARITGSDRQYGLARDFLEPTKIEREHFNRPRTIINFTYEMEADSLYEVSEAGERWIIGVIPQNDGTIKTFRLSDAVIKAWVEALDNGASARDARRAGRAADKGTTQ